MTTTYKKVIKDGKTMIERTITMVDFISEERIDKQGAEYERLRDDLK